MDYEGEKNEFVWCMMIKHFLKTVLPEIISRPDLLDSMEVREQIGGNLYFLFGKQCTGRHLPWRIFTEFLDLLVAYILLDKNLDYLQQISSKNSSLAEATHKFCYAAINHSLFVVRIASSSYIGAMFRLMGMEADDDEDYQNLFQDAKTSLESISELNRTSPNVNDSKCDGILFFKQKLISLSQMKLVIQILILAGGGGRRQDAMRCLIHFFEEAQEIIGGFNSMELLCYSLQESDSFDSVEKSGSYRLTTRILDECLPSIVEEYGVSGRLDTFPFFMFGFDSQLKFLTKTCRLLIPLYVVSDKFDLVPDLAASIGRSTLDLLLKTAPYIMVSINTFDWIACVSIFELRFISNRLEFFLLC